MEVTTPQTEIDHGPDRVSVNMPILQALDVRRADVEVTLDLVVGGGDSPELGLLEVAVDRVLYVVGVPRMKQFAFLSSL